MRLHAYILQSLAQKQEAIDAKNGVMRGGRRDLDEVTAKRLASYIEPVADRMKTVRGRQMESVNFGDPSDDVDPVEEIRELQKSGITVLGVWNEDGTQYDTKEFPLNLDRIREHMPKRLVSRQDGDNTITEEVEDDTPRDVNLIWGQGARDYG